MPSRLGVRQRLALLVMLPVTMSVATVVPFTVDQIDNASAANDTARQIQLRTQVADVVQQLQRERLLDIAYLNVKGVDRGQVLDAQQASIAAADQAGFSSQTNTLAGITLGSLASVRAEVLEGTGFVDPVQVYRAFGEAVSALLAAVPLVSSQSSASSGTRALITLDALLRADEQTSSEGAALLVILSDPSDGGLLLNASITARDQQLDLLHRSATTAQASEVDAADQGVVARKVGLVIATMNGLTGGLTSQPSDVLATVLASQTLHRLVEDQIIDDEAAQVAATARSATVTAAVVGGIAILVLAVVIVFTVRLSRSISARLRRLTRAVGAVADMAGAELVRVFDADDEADPPRLVAVDLRGNDELSELAAGFNRVQATAVLLLQRQLNTRRNVAVMFTNIARRTQHLVGRQLSLLDGMERDERDARVLEKLYRLDHIATRLSRSADSLLVIAGTPEESLASPMALLDVVRAGTAEIERFQAVHIGRVCDVAVTPVLAGDLRLLLAELLENATAASPPGVPVEVSAYLDGDECEIAIVDHGIGMSAARLTEENRQMVEPVRLESAPTQFLGLFVVGRLARRHGLSVYLEPSPGTGVTVTIRLPDRLWTGAALPVETPAAGRGVARAAQVLPTALAAAALRAAEQAAIDPDFNWFATVPGEITAALPPGPARGTATVAPLPPGGSQTRGDLRRRTPGQFRGVFAGASAADAGRPLRDPAQEASELDAFGAASLLAEAAIPALSAEEAARFAAGDPGTTRPAGGDPATARPTWGDLTARPTGGDPGATRPDGGDPGAATTVPNPPTAWNGTAYTRAGLQRRVPGANLAESVRADPADRQPPADRSAGHRTVPPSRDPAAERADLDGFVAGVTRAEDDSTDRDVLSQERYR